MEFRFITEKGEWETEPVEFEELITTGLARFKKNDTTENSIRAEHHYPLRVGYAWPWNE
jgi:hypothetical protein